MIAGRVIVALSIVCAALMFGCSGGSSDDANAVAQPEVDPRFASAAALTDHYNQLNTALPRNFRGMLPLYHLENDFQRKKWEVVNRMAKSAHYDLEDAFYERYGEPSIALRHTKLRACTPAVLSKVEEQRAEGVYNDQLGRERPLHLIKIDDRWWISGYTLEYETDTDSRDTVESVTDAMLSWDVDAEFLRPLISRIRAGEFESVEEARKAVQEAMRKNMERETE